MRRRRVVRVSANTTCSVGRTKPLTKWPPRGRAVRKVEHDMDVKAGAFLSLPSAISPRALKTSHCSFASIFLSARILVPLDCQDF
jgi:hypothetical protein